jgi:HAE1 family hydrophobic/amphiphilic exporter-1
MRFRRRRLPTIPGIRLLQIKEMGVDVMATAAAPIQILVYGPDFALTSRLAEESLKIAKAQVSDLFQPGTSWSLSRPLWRLRIDLAKAAQMGLTAEAIAQQAFYALKGGYTQQFYRFPEHANRRQTTILIRYEGVATPASDRLGAADAGQRAVGRACRSRLWLAWNIALRRPSSNGTGCVAWSA